MKCQLALFLPASHPNQTSASSPEQGLGNSSLPGSGCPRSLVLDSVRSQSSSPGAPSQSGKCGLFMCMCTRTCICIHTHTHTHTFNIYQFRWLQCKGLGVEGLAWVLIWTLLLLGSVTPRNLLNLSEPPFFIRENKVLTS